MLRLLHGKGGVWPRITELVNNNQRNYVAVAFVSSDAHELLPLSSGDTLVVDMSRERVRSGATNPYAVRKFVEAGVSVFTYKGLHAKVSVLGNRTVVGSANVSNAANNHLDEAVLITNDASIRKKTEKYVEQLKEDALPVTELMLKKREAEFRETTFHSGTVPQAPSDSWSLKMMRRIASKSVVLGRRAPYLQPTGVRAIQRIYLRDSDGSVVLTLHPADTRYQAMALYGQLDANALDVNTLIDLVSDDGWEAWPNLHLGYRNSNLRNTYTTTRRTLRAYMNFWRNPPTELSINAARKPAEYAELARALRNHGMMESSETKAFLRDIRNRRWVSLRPGLTLRFTWDAKEASMTEVLSKINEAMGTWGEQVVRTGAGNDRTLSVRVTP